jgi:hypothetical protein
MSSQQPSDDFCLADWAISPEEWLQLTDTFRARDREQRRFQSANVVCLEQYRRQQQNKKPCGTQPD